MDQIKELNGEMSGLEQLRGFINAAMSRGIGKALGFTLVAAEDGFAAFEGTPGVEVYNPVGRVHGGYAATLLDSACGCAVHSKLPAGTMYTTLEIKVAYHKAITKDTGTVRAEGRVLTMGRRVAFTEAKMTDASGRLLASATSTLLVMAPAAPGA